MFDFSHPPFDAPVSVHPRPGPFAPLQQSPVYNRAVQMMGGEVRYIDLADTGAWHMRRRIAALGEVGLVSRGPASLDADTALALREAVGARHLIVNAETEAGARALGTAGFWRIGGARRVAELDLRADPATLAARLDGKWRNRLRHGQQQGLHLTRSPLAPSPHHWIFEVDATAGKTRRYRPMSPCLVAAMAAARPGAVQLFTARRSRVGAPLAAMLFVRHGKAATYQVGWAGDEGRALSAGNLLMWRAMLELQGLGVETIDLGAADECTAPGLAHFKCGTGARLRDLGGTWLATAFLPKRPRLGLLRKAARMQTDTPPGAQVEVQTTTHVPAPAAGPKTNVAAMTPTALPCALTRSGGDGPEQPRTRGRDDPQLQPGEDMQRAEIVINDRVIAHPAPKREVAAQEGR